MPTLFFSRGVRLKLEECIFLFISGTASIDENGKTVYKTDFLAQAKHTFSNLTALFKSERATWHDVVQTTCKHNFIDKQGDLGYTKFYSK